MEGGLGLVAPALPGSQTSIPTDRSSALAQMTSWLLLAEAGASAGTPEGGLFDEGEGGNMFHYSPA